ncbi:unnamed protein product, partial [Ixodes pacificus]
PDGESSPSFSCGSSCAICKVAKEGTNGGASTFNFEKDLEMSSSPISSLCSSQLSGATWPSGDDVSIAITIFPGPGGRKKNLPPTNSTKSAQNTACAKLGFKKKGPRRRGRAGGRARCA